MVRLRDIVLFVFKIYSFLKRQVKVVNKSKDDIDINGIKSKLFLVKFFI